MGVCRDCKWCEAKVFLGEYRCHALPPEKKATGGYYFRPTAPEEWCRLFEARAIAVPRPIPIKIAPVAAKKGGK